MTISDVLGYVLVVGGAVVVVAAGVYCLATLCEAVITLLEDRTK